MTHHLRRLLKLRGLLSDEEIGQVAGGYDVVGDIAIVKVKDLDKRKRDLVGEALLGAMPSVRSVWNQVSPVSGDYRVRGLEHLAGEERTRTVYKEHGCSFLVDVSKVYFSPRLSGERLRVALLVRDGEVIHNMFAGVGPFSVIIAKNAKGVRIYSSEINPDAYELMVENVRLNRVEGSVVPLLGDALDHARGLSNLDRVLLPLPEGALRALPAAAAELRERGIAHVYLHVGAPSDASAISTAMASVEDTCPTLVPYYARVVREIAPRVYQVVVDSIKFRAAPALHARAAQLPVPAQDTCLGA